MKTTILLIIYSTHVEMIAPITVGNTVAYRKYIGYVEMKNAGKDRNYVFDSYTNEPSYTISDVFNRINETISYREIVFEGVDQLPISGEAEFEVGNGNYKITW